MKGRKRLISQSNGQVVIKPQHFFGDGSVFHPTEPTVFLPPVVS